MEWTTDTIDVPLSDLTGTYASPVHEIDLADIATKTSDSLQLTITERAHITWNRPVFLPELKVTDLGLDTPVQLFPNHTIKVDAYQVSGIFPSDHISHGYSFTTETSEINGYTIKRHYHRIVFSAALLLYVSGPKGDTAALRGRVNGSKAGMDYYSIRYN